MKCPKCGYNSFDHLENCKKCGNDLLAHKSKFGLRSLLFPSREPLQAEEKPGLLSPVEEETDAEAAAVESSDFGFDFMNEDEAGGDPEEKQEQPAEASLQDLLGEEQRHEKQPPQEAAAEESVTAEPLDFDLPPPEELSFDEDAGEEKVDTGDFDTFSFDEVEGELAPEPEGDSREDEAPKKKKKPAEEPEDPFDRGGSSRPAAPPENGPEEPDRDTEDRRQTSEREPDDVNLAELFLGSIDTEEDRMDEPAATEPDAADAAFAGQNSAWADIPETRTDARDGETPTGAEADPALVSAGDDGNDLEAALPAAAPPPLGARLAAGLVDLGILLVVFVLFLATGKMALAPAGDAGVLPSLQTMAELAVPYFLVLFAVCFGYFTLFHFLTGQTPGKMFFRLRVESEQGVALLFSQAFLRSVGGLLSLIPAGLGYLRIVVDRERRGWNDRLAGSRVVTVDEEIKTVNP